MIGVTRRFIHIVVVLALIAAGRPTAAWAGRQLHVLLMTCSDYDEKVYFLNKISESCLRDREKMTNVFRSFVREESWGIRLSITDLWGRGASSNAFWQQFDGMCRRVGETDTVVVYFTGHGAVNDQTRRPILMATDQQFIERDQVVKRLKDLPCKLRVLITDCCSTLYKVQPAEGDEKVLGDKAVRKLFLEHTGFTDISAASTGQAAYATLDGGYFTMNLTNDLIRYTTWRQVFDATRSRVTEEVKAMIKEIQQPVAISIAQPDAKTPVQPTSTVDSIVPSSDQRPLTSQELRSMGLRNLYLARNEIFARHGYVFRSPYLQRYFGELGWYRPGRDNAAAEAQLSRTERANVALIKQVEAELGGPVSPDGTPPSASESPRASNDSGDVFPYSSEQLIPRDVAQALSGRQLSIARNEIFARHGYIFRTAGLRQYFEGRPWYSPQTSEQPELAGIERSNVALLEKLERIRGGAYRW